MKIISFLFGFAYLFCYPCTRKDIIMKQFDKLLQVVRDPRPFGLRKNTRLGFMRHSPLSIQTK